MQSIAKFAMRTPLHAIGLSVFSTLVGFISWLSPPIVALILLSKGLRGGGNVFLWTLIPIGIVFHFTGDPTLLFNLTSVFLLALALRSRFSWEHVLVLAFFFSLFGTLLYHSFAPLAFQRLIDFVSQLLSMISGIPALENKDLVNIVMFSYSLQLYFYSIAGICLARWWQSCLYNPFGFGREFRSLRLHPYVATVAVLAVIFCIVFIDRLWLWIPLLASPLFIAALGLMHWVFAAAKISSFWSIGLYVVLLVALEIFVPLLVSIAIIDSFFDLRSRYKFSNKE